MLGVGHTYKATRLGQESMDPPPAPAPPFHTCRPTTHLGPLLARLSARFSTADRPVLLHSIWLRPLSATSTNTLPHSDSACRGASRGYTIV